MQSNKSNGQLTAQVSINDHKKSGFDLSSNVLGTGKIGRLYPTRALHVMPGDTIKQDSKVAVQFEPLAVPLLANMEVKQEHFYVPYNVVWKNWDKFISGGEQMNYLGVVPNTSIVNMVGLVIDKLFPNYPTFARTNNPTTGDGELILINYDPWPYEAHLDSLGAQYEIKDLLAPQYEALKLMKVAAFNGKFHIIAGQVATLEIAENVYNSFLVINGLSGNKYLQEIKPFILNAMLTDDVIMPDLTMLNSIRLWYDYIASFVGLGSNIDYLNMGRLSFPEFLVLIMSELMSVLHQGNLSNVNDQWQIWINGISGLLDDSPLSILHLRANYSVWYNNYRDILLESGALEPVTDDIITNDELFMLLVPRQRCWEKDAFTTALDNPGTGNVGVPLYSKYNALRAPGASPLVDYHGFGIEKLNDIGVSGPTFITGDNQENVAVVSLEGKEWKLPTAYLSGINSLSTVDTELQGFTLYALDAAKRAQSWLQKALFFGNRISDFYYLRYGVRFLDARLRLPELLTSSSELVRIDTVMNNTSIPSENVVAGDRAGYASAYDKGNSFDRFCEEHGVILSYLTVMPQVTYAYGCNRDYSRLDQFDFAFGEFATLGMDAVYDTEITASSLPRHPQVFGYQGKYYDYKAKHSEEHGELLDSQDMYTFARKFNMFDPNGRPKLNYEFVHCFPSLDMFVVDSPLADMFRFDIRHSTAAERGLPSQSIYIS